MFSQPPPPLSVGFSTANRAFPNEPLSEKSTTPVSASSISLSPLSFDSNSMNQHHSSHHEQSNPNSGHRLTSKISSSTSSALSSIDSEYSQGRIACAEGVDRYSDTRTRDGSGAENDEEEEEEGEREEELRESGSRRAPSRNQASSFIYKLYSILEDPNNFPLISYGRAPGSFEVHDIVALSRDVLPKYFKHSNFASFARQLNMWGWKKESRFGGWIFLHPIFRAGRRDLLVHIKRSDEAGKKRPESVLSRRKSRSTSSRPLGSSIVTSEQPRTHRSLSLYTLISNSDKSSRLSHPHSAPASTRSEQRQLLTGAVSRLDTDLLTSRPLRSSPAPLISPLFNPDGSHTRPVSPPSFVDDPRPYPLPPSAHFGGPQPEQRRQSFQLSSYAMQLEEAKRRLAMTTTLLDHVLDKLRATENQEDFQSFPFYVLDPRFQDPTIPLHAIVSEYDARRVATSVPSIPIDHPPQNRMVVEHSLNADNPVSLQPRVSHDYNTSTAAPLPTFARTLPISTSSHASHHFDPLPAVSPMPRHPHASSYCTRNGSFDTRFSGPSPQDSKSHFDLSFNRQTQGTFPSTRVVSPEDDSSNPFRYNICEVGGPDWNPGNDAGAGAEEGGGGGNQSSFAHQSLRILHPRPSTAAPTARKTVNTLGPSSFSLVDFSNNRAPSRNSVDSESSSPHSASASSPATFGQSFDSDSKPSLNTSCSPPKY
ncbi:hypothetical protein JCM5350_001659 [Sporobolomyces pararoseus]